MFAVYYLPLVIFITLIWLIIRIIYSIRNHEIHWKREFQLLFVYVCIVVVARFTFFPFDKVDGEIQPLVFSTANAFPFRINWIPIVNLLDYPDKRSILINVIGNTTMFIPLGIVWPSVYKELNTPAKAIAAGIGVSLVIEILQLPFFDRVSDIDDLILNTLGFIVGYGIYMLVKKIRQIVKSA